MLKASHKPLVRYFNELIDHGPYYEKKSTKPEKLREEFYFLSNVPESLKHFYPRVYDFQDLGEICSYKIEKIATPDASSFLIGDTSHADQKLVLLLGQLNDYLEKVPVISVEASEFNNSIVKDIFEKNLNRLKEIVALKTSCNFDDICKDHGFESVEHYCLVLNQALKNEFDKCDNKKLYFSHGDLCLSNILPLHESIYFIDPKGYKGDLRNTFRIIHYDLAKLSHSLFGSYDSINHHLFELKGNEIVFHHPQHRSDVLVHEFKKILDGFDVDLRTIRMLEASLFLSLIPFHQESKLKIKAFLINSLNIFNSIY